MLGWNVENLSRTSISNVRCLCPKLTASKVLSCIASGQSENVKAKDSLIERSMGKDL